MIITQTPFRMSFFGGGTQRHDSGVDGGPAACGRGCRDGCACPADDPEDAPIDYQMNDKAKMEYDLLQDMGKMRKWQKEHK